MSLYHCIFKSKDISPEAKRGAYIALVVSIALYGFETWRVTAEQNRKLESLYNDCARKMKGISM